MIAEVARDLQFAELAGLGDDVALLATSLSSYPHCLAGGSGRTSRDG